MATAVAAGVARGAPVRAAASAACGTVGSGRAVAGKAATACRCGCLTGDCDASLGGICGQPLVHPSRHDRPEGLMQGRVCLVLHRAGPLAEERVTAARKLRAASSAP
jgi:hypothetical protein